MQTSRQGGREVEYEKSEGRKLEEGRNVGMEGKGKGGHEGGVVRVTKKERGEENIEIGSEDGDEAIR